MVCMNSDCVLSKTITQVSLDVKSIFGEIALFRTSADLLVDIEDISEPWYGIQQLSHLSVHCNIQPLASILHTF